MRGRNEGRKDRKVVSLGPGSPRGHMAHVFVTFCQPHGSIYSGETLSFIRPQAVDCDIIDLGGGNS